MQKKNIKKEFVRYKIVISILLISLVVFIGYNISKYIFKTYLYPLTYFDIIKNEANKNKLDPYLVLAIIKSESGFNKDAISKKNAKGLMQIMDSTANEISKKQPITENIDNTNIFDPNVNISIGCNYFATLHTKYRGNIYIAICAYNAGMGNVDKWLETNIISKELNEYKNIDLPFKQTSKYLHKVISSYNMYKFLYK
ncbi:MAG: lytic transglycosylase domain-containing protein [Clostridia bacterium]